MRQRGKQERSRAIAEVIGAKGAFRFCLIHAVSCGRVEGEHGRLWDIRLDAWIRLMQLSHAYDFFKHLKKGDVINIPGEDEAWEILRNNKNCASCYGFLTERHVWHVPSGDKVSEPDDFRAKCALRMLFEGEKIEDRLKVLSEYAGREGEFLNAKEFEFVLAWHDLLEVAARTVNAHIDRGDFKPNMGKVDTYLAYVSRNNQLIDAVSVKSDYAAELLERHNEFMVSRKEKWQKRIGPVMAFRPSRFPKTRIPIGV